MRMAAVLLAIGMCFAPGALRAAHAAQPAPPVHPIQSTPPTHPVHPVQMPFSSQWDMTAASGRTYRIFVAWPAPPAKPPPQGYPVVYVLDGNALFGTAVAAARTGAATGELRPALIVGIGYATDDEAGIEKQRVFDLSPPMAKDQVPVTLQGARMGGADAFYAFIVSKLRPRIAAMFDVDAGDQSLVGHSLGGLFVLKALLAHPDAFRSYVAASPSIWWNDRAILRGVPDFATAVRQGRAAPRVLLAVGGLEQTPTPVALPPGMTAEAYAGLLKMAKMVDNVRALGARLGKLSGKPDYRVVTRVFPGETHTSVMAAAVSRGVGFALKPSVQAVTPSATR